MICSLSIVVLPGTVSYFVFVLFAFEKVVVLPALRVHSETTASGQQIPPPPPNSFPANDSGGRVKYEPYTAAHHQKQFTGLAMVTEPCPCRHHQH